jgi:hypothetical protein
MLPTCTSLIVEFSDHPTSASPQARFRREQITFAGEARAWTRKAESGNALTFHFCPVCGSSVPYAALQCTGRAKVFLDTSPLPSAVSPTRISRTDHRGVGGGTPPLGVFAARHATQARGKAGMKKHELLPSGHKGVCFTPESRHVQCN